MAKSKNEVDFVWAPRGQAQQIAKELWKQSRIMFLVGPAGGGKSHCAMGLALSEVFRSSTTRLILSRPQITVGENAGFLPGTLEEKLLPWLGPLHDVWSAMSGDDDWNKLVKHLGKRIETIPVGMLRGRTVRDAVLILDEGQNCSHSQLKCALTRIGEYGRLIITGDADQSDRFRPEESPLMDIARRLGDLDAVTVVRFTHADQQRDPLICDILDRL
jgi:phosphate starvation-inducible PhoH-like protein